MAIADYLRKLVELKNQLVANLKSMGVSADENEKLNTLVPKVLECKTEQNVEFVEGLTTNFNLNTACKSITIPYGVTSIASMAFRGYSRIISIDIPNSVQYIESEAFMHCTSLKSITIPEGVPCISSSTFYNCIDLTSIIIPESVKNIYTQVFYFCKNLSDIYYTGTQSQWNAITKADTWDKLMGSNVSGGTTIHYNYVPE